MQGQATYWSEINYEGALLFVTNADAGSDPGQISLGGKEHVISSSFVNGSGTEDQWTSRKF